MERDRKDDLFKQCFGVLGAGERETGAAAMKTNDAVTDPVCSMSIKPEAAKATESAASL